MSRKRRNHKTSIRRRQRVTSDNAIQRRKIKRMLSDVHILTKRHVPEPIQDRRRWTPDDKPARNYDGRISRVTVRSDRAKNGLSGLYIPTEHPHFKTPKQAMVCKRRKSRREVMFALNRAGKGKKVSKYRKRNDNSNVRCK